MELRTRKFLLKLRVFARYRHIKRRYRAISRKYEIEKSRNIREVKKLTDYYEKRLEVLRQENQSLLFAGIDRAYQAMKLPPVSYVASNATEKAEMVLRPPDLEPTDPLQGLNRDELNYYLDTKDGFMEVETTENGRTDAEAESLWNKDFKANAIADAKQAIF